MSRLLSPGVDASQGDRPSLAALAGSLSILGLTAFVLANLLDDFAFFRVASFQASRMDVPTPLRNATSYVVLYAASLVAWVLFIGHARRLVRYLGYAVTAWAITTHLGFKAVNGYGFTYHEASLVWAETAFIDEALGFFAASWIPIGLGTLAALYCYERFAVPRLVGPSSLLWCALPLLVVPAHAAFLEHTFCKVYQTPVPFRVPMLLDYARKVHAPYVGPREAPFLEVANAPLADHIVLIVDESIRGDLLGVNGGPGATTEALESRRRAWWSYGVASSPSNASATSHIILQSGLQPTAVPDLERRSLKGPYLFAYLQHAGFAAFQLNTQHYSLQPTNFMTRFDVDALDGRFLERREYSGRSEWDMDLLGIDRLERLIAGHERSFTYWVKAGAHFPYKGKHPPDAAPFATSEPERDDPGARRRTSYLNVLSWTVGHFLAELIDRLEATGESVLVFYTADHGQSLVPRRGERSVQPHGVLDAPPSTQANVPLVLLGFGQSLREALAARYLPELRDRVSAFEIFPTLLAAAGYDASEVAAHYGIGLFDARERPPRAFISGNLFAEPNAYEAPWIREGGSAVHLNRFELDGTP